MRHPWYVQLCIHEGAILRVLSKRYSIKRHLLRAQIKKILRKDFDEHAFRMAYLTTISAGWARERSQKDEVTLYPRGRSNSSKKKRETWLRNRNRMSEPYDRYGF